jgi:hypothetical protein
VNVLAVCPPEHLGARLGLLNWSPECFDEGFGVVGLLTETLCLQFFSNCHLIKPHPFFGLPFYDMYTYLVLFSACIFTDDEYSDDIVEEKR